ncbi:MAG: molybdopterin cofactor-binding domain-containing protein [Pseudomonadota bacterium]
MATRDLIKNEKISRRSFIASSAGAGLMLSIGSVLPGCSSEDAAKDMASAGASKRFSPNMWIEIAGDGAIQINIPKAEMGQHVGTSLARIIADEMGANWDDISIDHADSDPKWGVLIPGQALGSVTGGSWSVFTSFAMISQAGAAARTILCETGAAMLGVEVGDCAVENSTVVAGDASVSFADIVRENDITRTLSDEELAALPMKAPADRKLIGRETKALDIPEKSTGTAKYGIDAEVEGMVYAHPLVPPTRYGSKINSIDDAAAKEIKGYQQTIELTDPSGWLQGWAVVIADDYPSAMKAAAAVNVDWSAGPTSGVTEEHLLAEGERLCKDKSAGAWFVNEGDVDAAQEAADASLSATYTTATALHFTLEPQNATVEVVDGTYHIHAGNQWHSLIIPTLAAALEVDESKIQIHQYYLGGGYGRRLVGDCMIPAALTAKAIGKPVKLVFQRDADSHFDCARSPSVQQMDASFDADGQLSGIEHGAAAGWPTGVMGPAFLGPGINDTGKWDSFSIAGSDHWYSLPNHRVRALRNGLVEQTFLPGWLRAVGPGWTSWAVESFMDEVAHHVGEDPLALRIALLDGAGKNAGDQHGAVGGANRLRAALEHVRDASGWGGDLPDGEGLGVAVCGGQQRDMATWVACVAHVAVDAASNAVKVKKIWQTIDCGTVVHPDGALAQAEGACLWGVSLALHEGTGFEGGRLKDTNLDSYTPLRMADTPDLEIHFMDSNEFPTGLGEPPLIPVAPAIANAIYAASGKRVREMPIRL